MTSNQTLTIENDYKNKYNTSAIIIISPNLLKFQSPKKILLEPKQNNEFIYFFSSVLTLDQW